MDMVKQALKDSFSVPTETLAGLTEDTDLLADEIVDSFGFLELVMQLEERAGVRFDFDETPPDQFTTYGALKRHVTRASAE